MSIDIVDLFETNPITKLNGNYQSKLIEKVKNAFTESQQQMFVASFYCYLNYHPTNDFVVDLDNVWKWLDFSQKYNAKYMLEKNFIINKDYKTFAPEHSGAKKFTKGGHNKEIIMLNIDTFKKFCLKAGTKKASEIHEYFIQLEYILQETLQEESNELKLQLQTQTVISEKEKEHIREKTLLEQFPNNTQCVYYGIIDNLSDHCEPLVKFGNSNNLRNRVKQHKETYLNFRLINVFKVSNKLQIENAIKEHQLFNERQRIITLKNKKYIELLNIQDLSFEQLDKAIKNIITDIEFSPENYVKILEQNKLLKKELEERKEKEHTNELILLIAENKRLKAENIYLLKKHNKIKDKKNLYDDFYYVSDDETEQGIQTIKSSEINNYGIVINKLNKYFTKNTDGNCNIDGKIYSKLCGTREDVWYGNAYKTSGGLIKNDLIVNSNGKIISKKKSITETLDNKFEKYGVNKPKLIK
jgi:hypothetical protein